LIDRGFGCFPQGWFVCEAEVIVRSEVDELSAGELDVRSARRLDHAHSPEERSLSKFFEFNFNGTGHLRMSRHRN
jgi:hypothetical protein